MFSHQSLKKPLDGSLPLMPLKILFSQGVLQITVMVMIKEYSQNKGANNDHPEVHEIFVRMS